MSSAKNVPVSVSGLLRLSLVIFLLFPFLFLLTQFQISKPPELDELWWAFKNSFIQAFFSSLFSLVMGFWVALGLVNLKGALKNLRRVFEVLCLLPNFLPPLFILLSILNVVEPFPMGLPGVILIHAIMNFGLVAVLLARVIENKVGSVAELAYVEGASRFQFITQGLFPVVRKDFLQIGLFIFVVCFGSFAVPLVVGGGRGTTIEVLIYEKIRLSHEWGEAVLLALIQSAFIFFLSFFVTQGRNAGQGRQANLNLIGVPSGTWFLVFISALYLYGYAQGFVVGLSMLSFFDGVQSEIAENFAGSLIMGISVGILCYGGLLLIAYCWPKAWFEKFLSGYVAPSTSLACFCLLIVSPNEGLYPYLKIPLAITLLSLNSLFRMGWQGTLQSLQSQITVAYAMGASRRQIFFEISLPQVSSRAGLLAGVAAIWACGDFAVSRILAHRDLTIAMMTETLMSGYRLNQAILLSTLIIVSGLICFGICVGGSRVVRRKFTP